MTLMSLYVNIKHFPMFSVILFIHFKFVNSIMTFFLIIIFFIKKEIKFVDSINIIIIIKTS